jgi:tetratricopeptide (TPR) repeat protein
MVRARNFFLLLALFFCVQLPCWSQVPSRSQPDFSLYSIRGTLRNGETSQPAEMVRTELKLASGDIVATSYTRSNGEFEFSGIRPGIYYIIVSVEGYEPIREFVQIIDTSKQGILIFLQKPNLLPKAAVGPAVSAHLLSLPQKARDSYQKGMQRFYDKKDAEGSLPFFQRAIADAPGCYEAWYEIGNVNVRLGKTAEAESAFQKSLEVSQGKFVPANIGLASIFSNAGKFAEAAPLARTAIEVDSRMWEGSYELGRAQAGLKQWAEAEKSALAAHQLNPDSAAVHLLLANIHMHKPDYPALIEDLEAYLKIEPQGAAAAQARSTIDQVRKHLANAKTTPAPAKQP